MIIESICNLFIKFFTGLLQHINIPQIPDDILSSVTSTIDTIIARGSELVDLFIPYDVAKKLFKLYNKMAMNLIKANVQRNAAKIDEVIEDISNIRWGFQKAIEIQNGTTTLEEVMKEMPPQDTLEHPALKEDDENAG